MEDLHAAFAVGLREFHLAVDLAVGHETLALVGPSGAGKTTVLRAIAGLLRPERGHVKLGGESWFDAGARLHLPPEQRSVGYVFQDYALFPHLTVEQNVRFGGSGPDGRELLERFGVAHLADLRPGAISGGERQRVALARALARRPSVLLLDEPLAALDTLTRARVRGELQTLLPQLGLPTILVTHDFNDAASLGDRVGALQRGRIRQLGTPAELLRSPADAFVASFTGANLLPGLAEPAGEGRSRVTLDAGPSVVVGGEHEGRVELVVHPWELEPVEMTAATSTLPGTDDPPGDRAGVRATGTGGLPEEDRVGAGVTGGRARGAVVFAVVTGVEPNGGGRRVRCGPLTADLESSVRVDRGERIALRFDPSRARVVPSPPR